MPRKSARLAELSDFLRLRRTSIDPQTVGIVPGSRRRTPGLRREELAQLAGIGATWYTFFEQGRDVRVSTEVLGKLSVVFALNKREKKYFYRLAGVPIVNEAAVREPEYDAQTLQKLLSKLDPYPAFVVDDTLNVRGWNIAGSVVFDYSEATPPAYRNGLRRIFLDPVRREFFLDYELQLRIIISALRANFVRNTANLALLELVRELEAASPDFKHWWSKHEVLDGDSHSMLELKHPDIGLISGRFTFMSILNNHLMLMVFMPDRESEEKIAAAVASTGKRC